MSESCSQHHCDCGCCEGLNDHTPLEVTNQPGLSAIAYRVGAHADFKQSMLARLSTARLVALQDLRTREDDDFSIALLDGWATVSDVLTFYQERIANESYLRTATERRSILELARAIGYELRPGVAASAYLAFKMDEPLANLPPGVAPSAPTRTTIDIGSKVQSVPEPGEQAQIYETIEKIEARITWNDIKPRLTTRQQLAGNTRNLLFEGIATNIRVGDGVLFRTDDGSTAFGVVETVALDADNQRTAVSLRLMSAAPVEGAAPNPIQSLPALSPLAASYNGQTKTTADLQAEAASKGFDTQELLDNFTASPTPAPGAIVLRTRAAIFGHNAPRWESLPANMRGYDLIFKADKSTAVAAGPYSNRAGSWVDNSLATYHDEHAENSGWTIISNTRVIRRASIKQIGNVNPYVTSNTIFLDNVYPNIAAPSQIVLQDGDTWGVYEVESRRDLSKSDFTLTGKVTQLNVNSNAQFDKFGIRTTTVFAEAETLPLARVPDPSAVAQSEIILKGLVDGLSAGQSIIVSGELSNARGVRASEQRAIEKVVHVLQRDGYTKLTLQQVLTNSYVRATLSISANVALATHGETKQEVLGSGDGSQAFQRFALRQPPLTYITASTPSGAASTLKIYVNDVQWHEAPSFYGRGPTERIFITRTEDDGRTIVQFGDGQTGARLPSGQENVRAVYRKGAGLDGNVKANQLMLLMSRPAGVKNVTNPQASSGGDNREDLSDARSNAPLTMLALERIVSLQDYEDFARAFSGIAKSLATWTRTGETRGVLVTVAGPRGAKVESGTPVHTHLLDAMKLAGDPYVPIEIKPYIAKFFRLSATVKRDPDFITERVQADVESALRARFAFEARAFGQLVTLSEVMAVMQKVRGVVAVDVDKLYFTGTAPGAQPPAALIAALPKPGANANVSAAELLTLDPAPIDLKVIE
jgi:hypothetical protein